MGRLLETLPEKQRQALYKQVPALAALRVQYVALCDECVQALMAGRDGKEEAEKRDAFYASLSDKEEQALREAGISVAQLQPYRCALCHDVGFILVNGRKVPCRCTETKKRARLQSAAERFVSFDDFDESRFTDPEHLRAAKETAVRLRAYCDAYPDNDRPHLCLSGQTGVGKSFLLACTVHALMKKGVRVRFLTAYELMELFHTQHMGEGVALQGLIGVPFLAIDDLGTEPMYRNVTIEYLLTLLEERMRAGRSFAIATNLNSAQIRERYGERIFSRLRDRDRVANYGLKGTDLRLSGRKQKNR